MGSAPGCFSSSTDLKRYNTTKTLNYGVPGLGLLRSSLIAVGSENRWLRLAAGRTDGGRIHGSAAWHVRELRTEAVILELVRGLRPAAGMTPP